VPYIGPASVGFFESLEQKIKVNPHSVGCVRIRATDPCSPGEDRLWLLISKHGSSSYMSLNIPYSCIQIDFRKYCVRATHYLLESDPIVQIRSLRWVLEGSLDGRRWVCLDERRLAHIPQLVAVYRCMSPSFCRFVRLTQTGLNSVKNHQLVIRRFELFGSVEYHSEAPMALPTAGFV
jgi:hypothetical protein